jgi:hypothetical protein
MIAEDRPATKPHERSILDHSEVVKLANALLSSFLGGNQVGDAISFFEENE